MKLYKSTKELNKTFCYIIFHQAAHRVMSPAGNSSFYYTTLMVCKSGLDRIMNVRVQSSSGSTEPWALWYHPAALIDRRFPNAIKL